MSKKSSKGKKQKIDQAVQQPVAQPVQVKLPNPVEFESSLAIGRSQHANRANYDDSNLQKFILQNNLHGKVVRIVADSLMAPVNGNLITKYTIYYRKG